MPGARHRIRRGGGANHQARRRENTLPVRLLDRVVDRWVEAEIVGADDKALCRGRRLPQPGISRCRRNWKNSTPSRSRRRIISGLRIISPNSEAIFRRRK